MGKYKNTIYRGSVRFLIFKDNEDHNWYGVGLEFNIVESGDDPREVLFRLFNAFQGYVESAQKVKARPQILNQKPDEEYEKIWDGLESSKENKAGEFLGEDDVVLPYVYTHGIFSPQF